jgi:uncharacterized protein YyaL (SSP411 family)
MPNRLAREQSPYLLQHAENPVDWYPWGAEAFALAREQDKPIFLSIGYSTCHWCHVMERESFENAEIAEVLNREFVPVKVDREERPDVDRVYMAFVQGTTGSGGWPMSVWLTPELKPFFGGTYFPPSSRWGRPGFIEVLREVARVWKTERGRVVASSDHMLAQLDSAQGSGTGESPPRGVAGADSLAVGVSQFAEAFDRRHGGFGRAPKFPRPSEILFLLREHARAGSGEAREMALQTLRAMALGGMRDHLGGGFHRYSVDGEWRVPHFEKMLYDQAQLALAYLEAGQASGDAFYTSVAEDTLAYVLRDLTGDEGGFYSAEDADSLPPDEPATPGTHKAEGAFYVWREAEVRDLTGPDFDVVRFRFGIEPEGNALEDPQNEFTGRNILHIARSIEDVASRTGRPVDDVMAALARARDLLFGARETRPRPHLDDKVLTAWNGLTIAALARAGRLVSRERAALYLGAARRAASFIQAAMWSGRPGLLRRYRAGDAAIEGYCEDYAALIWGLLELFQADGDPSWLEWAIALQRQQDELFWDEAGGGWFSTTGRDPSVLLRLKEDYDGAEPSAISMSVLNLQTIGHLTGDVEAAGRVERTLGRYGPHLGRLARAVPLLASALSAYHAGGQQIAIVGPPDREDTQALQAEIAARYLPFAIVVPIEPGRRQKRISAIAPFVEAMDMASGRATAYVCREFTCRAPSTDVSSLREALGSSGPRA